MNERDKWTSREHYASVHSSLVKA